MLRHTHLRHEFSERGQHEQRHPSARDERRAECPVRVSARRGVEHTANHWAEHAADTRDGADL